jgi:hypothetical protein
MTARQTVALFSSYRPLLTENVKNVDTSQDFACARAGALSYQRYHLRALRWGQFGKVKSQDAQDSGMSRELNSINPSLA